jgi:outer membrane receptor protein involved in Fe transport
MVVSTRLLAASDGTVEFAVHAGDLRSALKEFGEQADLNVNFTSRDVLSLDSPGVTGTMLPSEALTRILSKSALCHQLDQLGQTVLVAPCKKRKANRKNERVPREIPKRLLTPPTDPEPGTGPVLVLGIKAGDIKTITVSRKDIERSGATSIPDLFFLMPQVFGGGPATYLRAVGSDALSNAGFGTGVNLLGQGADACLILIDGHRPAPSGDRARFADVANIPIDAIDHIDVLTESASALYGADAVGGVINFVMLDGSRASETHLQAGTAWGFRYSESHLSQTLGKTWSLWDDLAGKAELVVEQDFESRLRSGPGSFSPELVGDLLPRRKLDGAFVHAEQYIGDRSWLGIDGLFTRRRANQNYTEPNTEAPADEQPERNSDALVQAIHLSAELRTRFGAHGETSMSLSRSVETERNQTTALQSDSTAGQSVVTAQTPNPSSFTAFSRIDEVRTKWKGQLASLPAGAVMGGLGGEYRQQVFSPTYSTDPAGTRIHYERDIWAAFGHLTVPIIGDEWSLPGLRNLDLGFAARYENYSDFGASTSPQLEISFVPAHGYSLRATWGKSFRAPSPPDLDESRNSIVVAPVADSRSPGGSSNAIVISGNRAELTQETATTRSVSAGVTDLTLGRLSINAVLDYFDITYRSRIDAPDITEVSLSDARYASLITPDPGTALQQKLCTSGQFFGDSSSCLAKVLPVVDMRLRNDDALLTRGFTFRGTGTTSTSWGDLSAGLFGTYLLKYSQTTTGQSLPVSLLNLIYHPLRFQMHSQIDLTRGPTSFGTTVNYSNSYYDNLSIPPRPIDSWTTVDLQLTYRLRGGPGNWLEGTSVFANVRNAFDRRPPLVAPHVEYQGYDAENALPLGRLLSVGFRKSW